MTRMSLRSRRGVRTTAAGLSLAPPGATRPGGGAGGGIGQSPSVRVRVWLAAGAPDARQDFGGLVRLVRDVPGRDPCLAPGSHYAR